MTTEQEAQVLAMLTAYQNGVKMSDLPELGSDVNPFNLITEVIYNGESRRAQLAAMLPYLEETCAYGAEWDNTQETTACTRVGNLALHVTLPIQSRMRGCLLNDDGSVREYLDPMDWRTGVRDGSRGMVMVELPDHYECFITNYNKQRVMMSEYPLPGYIHIPKCYVSAYQATIDRTDSSKPKLASVVNTTAAFRGGNNNSDYDGKSNSFLGVPASDTSRTAFRNYARNRNNGDTQWNEMVYDVQKELYWLYVVEYANRSCQLGFNSALTTEGYHQGGLGNGVSDIDWNKWGTFNGQRPFIPCGYTDQFGNFSGVKDFTMPTEYDSTNTKVTSVPRYRGVENPFAHIWQWADGINVEVNPGDTGVSRVFICSDPAKFSDTGYDGYRLAGNEARKEGYVKNILFGAYGDIDASEVGAGNTTHFGDYHYTNIPSTTTLRGVVFGGGASDGASCGFVCSISNNVPSVTWTNVGSRLCYIPKVA